MEALLTHLYEKQLELKPDPYLEAHSRLRSTILRHIDAVELYKPYLKGGKILDWGCRHAVDACLIRSFLGNDVEIHGCDVSDFGYKVFWDFARLQYSKIDHSYRLPYSDNQFDFIVGSGVLEHVPNDQKSLDELFRILKPDGHLAITFLPNSWSFAEALLEALRQFHHVRRYSLRRFKRTLLHSGFRVVKSGYHQVVPTLAGGDELSNLDLLRKPFEKMWRFNRSLESLWPLNRFASNVYVVAIKCTYL